MKITDKDNLQHYLEGISGVLDGKARAKHRHTKVNGYSVLISDTVPTENDETVITLLVDTEYVPALSSLSVEQNGFVDYSFGVGYLRVCSFTTTVQALVDGAPADAEYQFEKTDGTVLQKFSKRGTYSGYNSANINIRVRTDELEEVFKLTFPEPTGAPNILYSGMYQNEKKYSSQGYTAASAGYAMVYKFDSGVSADEIANGEVAKIIGTKQIDKEPADTAEALQILKESMVLGPAVPLTIAEDRAYANFQETYTEDDIGKSVEFLFTVNMTDGSVFDLCENFKIKDDPATDSFVNHIQNLRFNPTGYGTVDPDLDNIVVLTSQTSGYKYIYLKFDLDKELAYDLKVTTTNDIFTSETTSTVSAGSTYLNSSRTVWRNWNGKTISDGPHEVSIHMEGGGYEETFTLTVYVATTEEAAKTLRDRTLTFDAPDGYKPLSFTNETGAEVKLVKMSAPPQANAILYFSGNLVGSLEDYSVRLFDPKHYYDSGDVEYELTMFYPKGEPPTLEDASESEGYYILMLPSQESCVLWDEYGSNYSIGTAGSRNVRAELYHNGELTDSTTTSILYQT